MPCDAGWHLRYFSYRCIRFIYDPRGNYFVANSVFHQVIHSDPRDEGVSTAAAEYRKALFGLNSLDVERKPWYRLLVDEVLHPFFVFQLFSVVLWSIENQYYYAASIFLISSYSVIMTLRETIKVPPAYALVVSVLFIFDVESEQAAKTDLLCLPYSDPSGW